VTATADLDVSVLQLVAHEMRAPLGVLRGYLSMLREEAPGGWPVDQAVPAMEVGVEELEGLVQILPRVG
jgi:signal transduction histidine kinase